MVEQLSFSLTWPGICFLSLVTTAKNQRTSLSSKCVSVCACAFVCARGRGTRSPGYHRVQAQETNATVNGRHRNRYWVISHDVCVIQKFTTVQNHITYMQDYITDQDVFIPDLLQKYREQTQQQEPVMTVDKHSWCGGIWAPLLGPLPPTDTDKTSMSWSLHA